MPSFIARALILFEIYKGGGPGHFVPPPPPRLRNSKKAQAEQGKTIKKLERSQGEFLTKEVLSVLINPGQTGFVKGRYMGQNIRLVNDILEQTKLQSIPGILLQLDFCKAFDTIEWSFIYKVIALLNFGGSMQRWISTFYSNSESAVLNNGFCTNYFKLSRGVRQGFPLSPYLFIITFEILACKIRQDREIKGISIFHKEFNLSRFADDTTLLCRDCNSVNTR